VGLIIERQRDTRLHPWPEATEENRQVRQAPLETAQPDRDHVWKAERLAACGNPIRPLPEGLPVSHRARGNRHLLAMSPDSKAGRRSKKIAGLRT
jgi:hypothetical protein